MLFICSRIQKFLKKFSLIGCILCSGVRQLEVDKRELSSGLWNKETPMPVSHQSKNTVIYLCVIDVLPYNGWQSGHLRTCCKCKAHKVINANFIIRRTQVKSAINATNSAEVNAVNKREAGYRTGISHADEANVSNINTAYTELITGHDTCYRGYKLISSEDKVTAPLRTQTAL